MKECVIVATPVAGFTVVAGMYMTSVVPLATALVSAVPALPDGLKPGSATVTVSEEPPPLMTTRYAPRVPRSAAAIVSDADTAAGDHAEPAATGVRAVSSAIRRTSRKAGPPNGGG